MSNFRSDIVLRYLVWWRCERQLFSDVICSYMEELEQHWVIIKIAELQFLTDKPDTLFFLYKNKCYKNIEAQNR